MVNPAYIGDDTLINSFFLYRNQWAAIPGSPHTEVLTLDGKLSQNRGSLGGYLINDQSNIIRKTEAMLSYGYGIEIADGQEIKAGISIGVTEVNIDFDKVIAQNPGEATLLQEGNTQAMVDGAIGLRYTNRALEVGLSANHLFNNTATFEEETNFKSATYQLVKNFYLHASYDWELSSQIDLKPTILLRSNQGMPLQGDIHVNTTWRDLLWLGVGFRSNYGVTLNVGGNLTDAIAMGYGYDLGTTGITNSTSGGSHELFLRVRIGGNRADRAEEKADSCISKVEVDHKHIVTLEEQMSKVLGKLDSMNTLIVDQRTEIDSLRSEKDAMASEMENQNELINEKLIAMRKLRDQLEQDRDKIHDFVDDEHVILTEVDTFNTRIWRYYVVVGTYTDLNYAKFLQRILARDYLVKTTVEASKDYYLVYSKEVFDKESAEEEVKRLNQAIDKEYLDGGAWVYHRRKNE